MNENNRVEYKLELNPDVDIEKEVIAFLNYKEGGFIYIGIDKDGNAVGVSNIDDCMLRLKDRLKNNILPSAMGLFDIAQEKKDGADLIKVTIASGSEKPYFKPKYGMTSKGCFIRVGSAVEPMSKQQIEYLFSKRTRNSIGRIVSNRQDLSFEQLRIYYDERGKRLNDNFKRSLELVTNEDKYNYVAYLLSDENGNSMKVAKYSSLNRCELEENNEYGYCSLIKSTKSILLKLEVENKTISKITPLERIDIPLWNRVALREAVINAIVHNDYSFEVPPKFEIFPDRLEITSYGTIPESMTTEDFFAGVSIPRNKELMRIYRDLELVESLGSGVPRILEVYGKQCYMFSDNFIRLILPISIDNKNSTKSALSRHQVGTKSGIDNSQIHKILKLCETACSITEIMKYMGFKDRTKFRRNYIYPLIEEGLVESTIPTKPNSKNQKYRLTTKGLELINNVDNQNDL